MYGCGTAGVRLVLAASTAVIRLWYGGDTVDHACIYMYKFFLSLYWSMVSSIFCHPIQAANRSRKIHDNLSLECLSLYFLHLVKRAGLPVGSTVPTYWFKSKFKWKKQAGKLRSYPPKRYSYQKSTDTYRISVLFISIFIYFDYAIGCISFWSGWLLTQEWVTNTHEYVFPVPARFWKLFRLIPACS